jgi:hypothetical protein
MPVAFGVNISMSSWPGSSRPSTPSILPGLEDVDARDNPRIKSGDGHDKREFTRAGVLRCSANGSRW